MTPTLQPGYFGLTQISGEVGRGIRAAQWLNGSGYQNFEHAFMVTDVLSDGTVMILEAEPGGAVIVPLHYDHVIWSDIAMSDSQRVTCQAVAADCKGIPYSFLDYGALAAHRLHVPGNQLLRGYVQDSGHMICSQMVDYVLMKADVHLFTDNRWQGYVVPEDLVQFCRAN